MKQAIADVRAFHKACDVPSPAVTGFPSKDRVDLRLRLIDEERSELENSIIAKDIEGVADAIADSIYVLVGTALEFGIPLDRVWAEVQRANMRKVDPETGKVRRREDGKILKPDGWVGPDIAAAMTADLFEGA